ncbi:MAG: triose-phosphate isomerase [Candidatus Dependentiae bacterium]
MGKKMFVANWKMQLSFDQACAFAHNHLEGLKKVADQSQSEIILCPSFPALYNVKQILKNTKVHIGAQTVSRHGSGAYTGQVSAQSLAQTGCTYCIIGHSENRKYQHESNVDIEQKCKELLKQNITPIICIGESKEAFEQKKTYNILNEQLEFIYTAITELNHHVKHYAIAYEPIWAIGTGIIPEVAYLTEIFAWLHTQSRKQTDTRFSLLYGGSVNAQNAHNILSIKHIDGLLIGGASLDFATFEHIIKN